MMRLVTRLSGITLVLGCLCRPAPGAQIAFEENRGQADASVRYFSRIHRGFVFFTPDSVVLYRPGVRDELRFRLMGAKRDADWEPEGVLNETVSYFVGRDRSKWVNGARRYERVLRRAV